MKTYERFLNYVRIHTASSEDSSSVPTTERQFDLANLLVKELHAIGVENARVVINAMFMPPLQQHPAVKAAPQSASLRIWTPFRIFPAKMFSRESLKTMTAAMLFSAQAAVCFPPKSFPICLP